MFCFDDFENDLSSVGVFLDDFLDDSSILGDMSMTRRELMIALCLVCFF